MRDSARGTPSLLRKYPGLIFSQLIEISSLRSFPRKSVDLSITQSCTLILLRVPLPPNTLSEEVRELFQVFGREGRRVEGDLSAQGVEPLPLLDSDGLDFAHG